MLPVSDAPKHGTSDEIDMGKQIPVHSISSKQVSNNIYKSKLQNIEKNKQNFSKAYEFGDVSFEIKHALTPINNISLVEKENVHVSLPSPNYPISASIGLESPSIVGSLLNTNEIPKSTLQSDPNTKKTYNQMNFNDKSLQKVQESKFVSISENILSKNLICQSRKSNENSFTVLNIPNISHCKNHVLSPSPPKRQRLSKIDLAVMRRKLRKEKYSYKANNRLQRKECETQKYNIVDKHVFFPDSSNSDNDEQYVDLWIRSGPPRKLDLDLQKLRFLKLLQLTTHYSKNSEYI